MLTHKLYSQTGEQASLLIDLPSAYKNSTTIYAVKNELTTARKIWDGGRELVYGDEDFVQQLNKKIKITANKPLKLEVNFKSISTVCSVRGYFIPESNKDYRLTVGTIAPTDKQQTFLESFVEPKDLGKCYFSVAKIESGKLVPITLKDFS